MSRFRRPSSRCGALGGAVGLEQAGREQGARPTRVVEAVIAARCLQLIAPERREQFAEADDAGGCESFGLDLPCRVRRNGNREDAGELEQTCFRERLQNGACRGRRHSGRAYMEPRGGVRVSRR